MHLVVYDATGVGGVWYQPLLTLSWRAGAHLYGVDEVYGARSWEDALAWLCSVRPREKIDSVQYWGHGFFGRVFLGGHILDVDALERGHSRHDDLLALRTRIAGEQSLFWFRTCSTFGGEHGHALARAWTRFFGCRAAGHTHLIGPLQSGLHSLACGRDPHWPISEGVSTKPRKPKKTEPAGAEPVQRTDEDQKSAAKYVGESASVWSKPWSPHTIACTTGSVPEGW